MENDIRKDMKKRIEFQRDVAVLYENICSYIDMENHYWQNINIINIDYELNKRIDGI